MGNQISICFELLQKLRARLESHLTNWVKVAISASLMYFAPELFFADTSTLSLFSSNRNRKQLNIGRIFPFRSNFPDLIYIGFQPVSLSKGYTLF